MEALEAEVSKLRETNARLNRRCQQAESAAAAQVTAAKVSGGGFSKSLALYYADQTMRENEALEAEVARLRRLEALVADWEPGLATWMEALQRHRDEARAARKP